MNYFRSALRSSRTAGKFQSYPSLQIRVMSTVQSRFTDSTVKIQSVFEKTTTDEKLKIYALYKQATKGKNSVAKPPAVDFEGAAKWKAWNALGDMTKEQAQQKYVDLVNSLLTKAGKEPVA